MKTRKSFGHDNIWIGEHRRAFGWPSRREEIASSHTPLLAMTKVGAVFYALDYSMNEAADKQCDYHLSLRAVAKQSPRPWSSEPPISLNETSLPLVGRASSPAGVWHRRYVDALGHALAPQI